MAPELTDEELRAVSSSTRVGIVRLAVYDIDNAKWRYALGDEMGRIISNQVASATQTGIQSSTLVASGSGAITTAIVSSAGIGAGTVHDAASVEAADATNIIGVLPALVANIILAMPFSNGLVVKPGTSQVISVGYL